MTSPTKIAVPISAPDLAQLKTQVQAALHKGAEILECRLDYLADLDVRKAREALRCVRAISTVPILATCRDPREGGQHGYDADTRCQILCTAIREGVDYIDLELENAGSGPFWETLLPVLNSHSKTRLILSSHDFEKPFADLKARYRQTRAVCESAIPKLVYMAHHLNDCFPAFDLLQHKGPGSIVLAMGGAGLVSRILAKKLGAHLTFASLDEASATAPGQLSLQTFKKLYRAETIDRDTELFGLIGDPVGHSLSPAIHNACFAQQDMNRLYLPFWISGDDPEFTTFLDAVTQRPWLGLHGFSVTIPHKRNALNYVQRQGGSLESLAAKIGAVNTLILDSSTDVPTWAGYNTDYSGAMDAIRRALKLNPGDLRDWPVAVVGAGGVARALVAGFCDEGARVTVYNRTVTKAEGLATEFNCTCAGLEELVHPETKLIVNCTSVGMFPKVEATPVPEAALKGVRAVFDTIYNPRQTRLLQQAQVQGAVGIDGVAMFVNQALAQFRLFTGVEADAGCMEGVLNDT